MLRHAVLSAICICISVVLYAQGLKFNDEAYEEVLRKKSYLPASPEGLPSSVDLSMYVPSVLNQGTLGTCVGVSTAYYMRTMLEAIRLDITDQEAIDALRFSPSFLYNAIKQPDDADCLGGSEINHALMFMKEQGVPLLTEQQYPYCSSNKKVALRPDSRILDYIRLFGLTDRQESCVVSTKKALSERTPVIVGIQTTPSLDDLGFWGTLWLRFLRFFGLTSTEQDEVGLWKPEESTILRGGHAICVVGFDDAKYGGAFQAVNSRGKYWGDNGFFWIRYSDYARHAKYGFQAYVRSKFDEAQVKLAGTVSVDWAGFVSNSEVPFRRSVRGSTSDTSAQSTNEQMVAYALRDPHPTGSKFKFSVTLDKQAYLYILTDNTAEPRTNRLFPHVGTSPIIGANTRVLLPNEKGLYELYDQTGTEYWLFLFSETPLDIDGYVRQMNYGQGDFINRVLTAFGDELIPYQKVDYNDRKIGFELKGEHSGRIVPLLVSCEQVSRAEGFRSRPLRP